MDEPIQLVTAEQIAQQICMSAAHVRTLPGFPAPVGAHGQKLYWSRAAILAWFQSWRVDGAPVEWTELPSRERKPKAPSSAPSFHPDYNLWKKMHQRCGNPAATQFKWYGARGITVCQRWGSFANFLADMGPRPSPKHSLDRIDNYRGYEPGNCRWATVQEQCDNRRCRHTAAEHEARRA